MPLPAVLHCCTFSTWFICAALFVFRKNLRIAHTFVGVGLLFVPLWFMRSEFGQLFRVRGGTVLTGIYVYNAYRISDEEIRLFFMQSTNDKQSLQYLDGSDWKSVEITCVCPLSTLISQCSVEAQLGVIRANLSSSLTLRVPKGTVERDIHVIDVRPQSDAVNREYPYPHKLGICVQPIYYHADWPAFIQFFEYWIASGATKFYIYLHSATPQVRKVINYYSKLLESKVEIIPWSDLPVSANDRGDFSRDPNTRLFRAGAYAAINDCLLRSRWQVKFVAMLDVDEVLVTETEGGIVKRLEYISYMNPFAATYSLEWAYGIAEEHKLDVRVISSENVMFDYARLRKVIQRPERVRVTDIHNTLYNENIPLPSDWKDTVPIPYETAHVNGTALRVLHLRRFHPRRRPISIRDSTPANLDTSTIAQMSSNISKRKDLLDLDMDQWWCAAEQTMEELESCRKAPFNLGTRIGKGHCRSLANCEPTLSSADSFIKEASVWTNVASRHKFIQYLV